MKSHGMEPVNHLDIVADDKWHDFQIDGDAKGKKKGFYTLRIDGDFVSGAFGDRRSGEVIQYRGRPTKKMTDEERREYARKREEDDKRREQEKNERHEAASEKARERWAQGKFGPHGYLERKQVNGEGTRVYTNGRLMVPMYAEGKLWGVQSIDEDGVKMFQSGGRKKGCFCPITTAEEDKSTICIAEGYATAATVRMATGWPTLAAFDAGNLIHVAKTMRDKYPEARIIICGDNDSEKFDKKGNQIGMSGQIKGLEAADAVNGIAVFPDVTGTDWNDLHVSDGLDAVKEKIKEKIRNWGKTEEETDLGEIPEYVDYQVPAHVYEQDSLERAAVEDWKSLLITNDKGKLIPSSLKNAILFLQHHHDFKDVFRLNDFQSEIYVARCPLWDSPARFEPHRLEDNDITEAAAAIERFGLNGSTDTVYKAIRVVAERNKFHPAREYFDSLEWDGVDRLGTWLEKYLGAHDDDKRYLSFIGRKWMTAAVKRVYEPACKFDHILVMEGKQGRGKSTAFEYLATFGGKPHFTDNIKLTDIQNKDTILLLQGSIIVELAELAGFNKKEDDEIKGWITVKEDRCRVPYGKTITVFKRQFVLGASTNNYEYLKDPTGNRRYWPCKVGIIDLKGIEQDREQLWAQAVHHYREGLYIGPTIEEIELAEAAQNKRLASDVWEDSVYRAIRDLGGVSFKTGEILSSMGISVERQDHRSSRRVNDILRKLGYENTIKKRNGKSERIWMLEKSESPIEPFEQDIEF